MLFLVQEGQGYLDRPFFGSPPLEVIWAHKALGRPNNQSQLCAVSPALVMENGTRDGAISVAAIPLPIKIIRVISCELCCKCCGQALEGWVLWALSTTLGGRVLGWVLL